MHEIAKSSNQTASLPETVLSVIGLGGLLSTLLIYSPVLTSFYPLYSQYTFIKLFAEVTLATSVVVSLIVALAVLRGSRIGSKMLVVAALLYGAGIVFFCIHILGYEFPLYTLINALISGAGCVGMGLMWGRIYKRFKLKQALVNTAIACIISSIMYWIMLMLPLPANIVVLGIATAVTLTLAFILLKSPSPEEASIETVEPKKALPILKALGNVIIAPVLGLFFFAYATGVMQDRFFASFQTYLVALVIASLIIAVYALSHRASFSTRSLHQTFIPLLAVILLTATSFTAYFSLETNILMFLIYLLYIVAAIITLATLSAVAHASEFSSDLVFAIALFIFSIASFLGITTSNLFFNETISVIIILTTTVYAFTMILYAYFRLQKLTEWDDVKESSTESPVKGTEKACRRLAEVHKLTVREEEILNYLAEGHNGAYISEVLFISPNTVRTHIHNIYRKLDITSREDILRLTRES